MLVAEWRASTERPVSLAVHIALHTCKEHPVRPSNGKMQVRRRPRDPTLLADGARGRLGGAAPGAHDVPHPYRGAAQAQRAARRGAVHSEDGASPSAGFVVDSGVNFHAKSPQQSAITANNAKRIQPLSRLNLPKPPRLTHRKSFVDHRRCRQHNRISMKDPSAPVLRCAVDTGAGQGGVRRRGGP